MGAVIDYEIWIPSRRRLRQVKRTLTMLPTAKVFVDRREEKEYRQVVGSKRLVLQDPCEGNRAARDMIMDACKASCLVMVDDDLRGVSSLTGRSVRVYREPGPILQIVENMVTIAADLGVKMFCWNRNPLPLQFFACDPIGLTGPLAGAWGMIGRDLRFDRRMFSLEDADLTMQCLLKHRLILCDRRFYWDFGPIWGGKGGNQGLRTAETHAKERAVLAAKWGRYLYVGESRNQIGADRSRKGLAMSVRVARRSNLAATR